jgi:hypothetical protein
MAKFGSSILWIAGRVLERCLGFVRWQEALQIGTKICGHYNGESELVVSEMFVSLTITLS